jgi:N-methylhydantoinase A
MPYQIGCDVGGTFTDVVVADDRGNVWNDKADTTPDDLSEGVERAIENVSDRVGVPATELLEGTDRFVNGTTVVTNNVVELDGAKTGLLVTKGTKDTLRIARSPRTSELDHTKQSNVPDIVPRDCIKEVPERIDYKGEAVVELDEDAVEAAVEELVEEEGVEAIAVCYLWSFRNADHEDRTRELIESAYPDLYVTTSNEVYPVIREFERMVTTLLNSYSAPDVATYIDRLQERLSSKGLDPDAITFMQSAGGGTTPERAKAEPVRLIDSGPVGGVIGVQSLGRQLDADNLICADMGGTSFECSIIEDGEVNITDRTEVREFLTGLTKIETNTIGAGGGSITWIDNRSIPQVGPESAGADPGPVCYGRGGTEPTLTDAAVALDLLDPDAFLGGRRSLEAERARTELERTVAEPLGTSVEEAAAAVYDLAVTSMSNAIRNVTVEEGRDPDGFTLVAYGGALPMYAADICDTLDIDRVVVPNTAPVFSAYGLLQADDVRTYTETLSWNPGEPVDKINETLADLESRIRSEMDTAGFDDADVTVEREGMFKFKGQLFDYGVELPDDTITREDIERIQAEFPEQYESEYGPGTAWVESPVIMRAVRVTGTATTEKPPLKEVADEGGDAEPASTREVYLPSQRTSAEIDIYDRNAVSVGTHVDGPAVVEEGITTVFVPDGFDATVDEYGNYVLTTGTEAEQRAEPTRVED